MKKIAKIIAGTVNMSIICAAVAVGAFHVKEVQAQERLKTITDEDRHCLAQNIFFEARNQSLAGQVAVAWVTLNRMEASAFPNSICGVVKQANRDSQGRVIKHKCQFSWFCDGKSDRIPSNAVAQRAWEDAQLIADVVLLDWARAQKSPVKNATFYHADYVSPKWSKEFTQVAVIEDHIFYAN